MEKINDEKKLLLPLEDKTKDVEPFIAPKEIVSDDDDDYPFDESKRNDGWAKYGVIL